MNPDSGAAGEPTASGRPAVSVVMTVYNDFRFLDAAVDSVLAQDFRDLELIIVDDGNARDAMFDALARRDPRIRIVVNPTNLGASAAANRGIESARGDIIARLDADDVAEPAWIGCLVAALGEDPQLGLVGSAVTLIDEADRPRGVQPMPETDLEIRWTILFHNPFYHSTVAFRRNGFERAGRYIASEFVSNDHYLWFHMLPLCRARNLAQPLVRYRLNPRGLTATHATKNPRNRTHAIRQAMWARLGLTYDLYDDGLARDVTQFLRGVDIPPPERRAPAFCAIMRVLPAFLAAPQPFAGPGQTEDARRLGQTLVARILATPPDDPREALAICRLCWPIDRRAALGAAAACLANLLRMKWLSATARRVRSQAN